MDYRSLTSLMLRLAGVFIVVSAVTSAPQIFLGLLYRGGAESVDIWPLAVAAFATFAVPFLVGMFLIYFPATVANRMVSAGHRNGRCPPPAAGGVLRSWPLLRDRGRV